MIIYNMIYVVDSGC